MKWQTRGILSHFHFVKYGPGARSTRAALGAWRPSGPGARTFQQARRAKYPRRPRVGQGGMQWSGRNEISLRNNLFRRLYRILLETRRAAWRGGFGNRGPPRGVMRSDAMNCGPPRVCLGSLSKSIKQRGIPCPDVLTNPVSHEKIGIRVLFFQMSTRRTARGTHRCPAPRVARVLRASTRRVPTRASAPGKPPFSLTPTCRRSSPAGAGG